MYVLSWAEWWWLLLLPIYSTWHQPTRRLNIYHLELNSWTQTFPPEEMLFSTLYDNIPCIYITSALVVPTLHLNYMMLTLSESFKPPCFHGCAITSDETVGADFKHARHFSCTFSHSFTLKSLISQESSRPRWEVKVNLSGCADTTETLCCSPIVWVFPFSWCTATTKICCCSSAPLLLKTSKSQAKLFSYIYIKKNRTLKI